MASCRQISFVRMTVARRVFKVTTITIACNFIWSVSQASNEGRGIRLPLALKKWHRQADWTDWIKSSDVAAVYSSLTI